MNITFFIGNGFDLNIGLRTRYTDFYKYYQENCPSNIISQSIQSDYKMWSDLEIGLGKFLERVSENQIIEFLDAKGNLERLLSEYLLSEKRRVIFSNERLLAEEFRNNIYNFWRDFNAIEQQHYKKVISDTNGRINYAFITFNYTDILDEIVSMAQNYVVPFGQHVCGNLRYTDNIVLPHHIHGGLDENLILGVDNSEQIINDKFKVNPELTRYVIKPQLNEALGEQKIQRADAIISNSKYICLYGLSLGATDTLWWRKLYEWLNNESNTRLVVFVRSETNCSFSAQERIRFIDSERERFLDRCCLMKSDISEIVRDKIIIVPNSKIFDLKNISLNDDLRTSNRIL